MVTFTYVIVFILIMLIVIFGLIFKIMIDKNRALKEYQRQLEESPMLDIWQLDEDFELRRGYITGEDDTPRKKDPYSRI